MSAEKITLRTEKGPVAEIDPTLLDARTPFDPGRGGPRRKQSRSPIPRGKAGGSDATRVWEYWSNLVANQRMWDEAGVNPDDLPDQCRELLLTFLGDRKSRLRQLEEAQCVEVGVPFLDAEADPARAFPWEFVIASATRARRDRLDLPATIVARRLLGSGGGAPPAGGAGDNFCFVESAPSPFDRLYGFDLEYGDIQRSLGLTEDTFARHRNPRRPDLERTLGEPGKVWDAVHVTGIDVHQGVEVLRAYGWVEEFPLVRKDDKDDRAARPAAGGGARRPDGVIVRLNQRELEDVPARKFAALLKGSRLVTLNLFNSAGSLAPLAVREGAGAVLGFQDTFDDDLTDTLFATFYLAWKHSNRNLLTALAYVQQELLPDYAATYSRADLGVVLWTGASLLEGAP